jgi:hypothetical protein
VQVKGQSCAKLNPLEMEISNNHCPQIPVYEIIKRSLANNLKTKQKIQ